MKFVIGFVLILVGFYIAISWIASSHSGWNFDPARMDNWLLFLLVLIPILVGLRLFTGSWFKKKRRNY